MDPGERVSHGHCSLATLAEVVLRPEERKDLAVCGQTGNKVLRWDFGPAAPVHLCEQVNLGTPSAALFALTPHTLAGLKANELQACLNRK